MALMTVYHGSGDVVAAPEIRVGRYTKDFGPGFYCTVIREQAERWAQRMPVPRVNTYVVRFAQGLDILEFPEMSEEWLDFIVACRHGESHSHDVVIGAWRTTRYTTTFPSTSRVPSRASSSGL